MKKIVYLGLLSSLLFGCGVNNSSSENKVSSQSTTSSSTVSLGPKSYELKEEMLDELNEGYSVDGFYYATVKGQLISSFYYEYNCTETVYEYTSYVDDVKKPSKDKVEDSYRYEAHDFGDGVVSLTLAKLNLNNEVVKYPVTDGYNYLTWDSTGFANIFNKINTSYFEKGENDFEFELKMNVLGLTNIPASLTSQFSSYMGLTAKSFTLITDGYHITNYKMTYQPLMTTSGNMDITVEGKFTNFGSDVVQPIQPFDGESNNDFDVAFENLREHTYKVDIDLGIKSYDMVVEAGENFIYDEFDENGKKISSYGFHKVKDGIIQGLTKINGELYADGPQAKGTVTDILPILNISSELFVLVEEKDGKLVFKYNEKAPAIEDIAFSYDYGIFGGSRVGDLTITISEDEVIIENELKYIKEVFRYYEINGFSRYFDDVKTSTNNLKWSDILSNQEEELEKLYEFMPKEALDQIPVVGGINARVDLDATYKPNEPVFTVPPYEGGVNVYLNYCNKLLTSGFEYQEAVSIETGKDTFTKECLVNGETKTLVVKLYLAQDYLAGEQFLIYPSMM